MQRAKNLPTGYLVACCEVVHLRDILKAIKKIEGYAKNTDLKAFKNEDMRHDAVIRQLEIIGEAVKRLSKVFVSKNPDFPIKEAIGMRNFLIHGYDDVDLEVVWKTINEDIPNLKQSIANLTNP